ncbi:MAG: peptidoglycan-binding protein [Firmicutes bacterium]|nr:peptidoglycan-binding protein [Bacillota bacterium]
MNIKINFIRAAAIAWCICFLLPLGVMADAGCPYCRMGAREYRVLAPAEQAVRGPSVEQLQKMLKKVGYYDGPVNGIYDLRTVESVRKFQKEAALAADGVVGRHTWRVLDQDYCLVTGNKAIPGPQGAVSIVVDIAQRKLTVFSDGEPFKQYTVAVGKYQTPSPVGNFKVLRRALHDGSDFGTRWMGLNVLWGSYGIHGTNRPDSIGSYASHGCVRMNNRDVEEIYPWVNPGTRVVLLGNFFDYQIQQYRLLKMDDTGGDVMEVQFRLRRLGYYDGPIDGIMGSGTAQAVARLRKNKGLPEGDCVDRQVYQLLGL